MFDETKGLTKKMRSKEQTEDYRFISDPDLPIIKLEKPRIKKISEALPETPHEKLKKIIKKHKIEQKHAKVLTRKLDIVEFFEKVIEQIHSKLAVPWITIELLRVLHHEKKELSDSEINIQPQHFIELLELLDKKKITPLKAKEILNKFVPKSFSPKQHAKQHSQISSKTELGKLAKEIIKENSKAVQDYKQGQKNALNFLIGQLMKKSNKRADYKIAKDILEKELS